MMSAGSAINLFFQLLGACCGGALSGRPTLLLGKESEKIQLQPRCCVFDSVSWRQLEQAFDGTSVNR